MESFIQTENEIMEVQGKLRKMLSSVEFDSRINNVRYSLSLGEEQIDLNSFIGKTLSIQYSNEIKCIHCDRKTKKSFAQGYCYPCFMSLPQTEACMLHPEKCEAHNGISRDMSWAEKYCLSDHIVYLALSPGLKVGVTRISQVPTRWIDQGAWETIILAVTENRYKAGLIEVFLKNYLADKTNWRHMLTGLRYEDIDLKAEKMRIAKLLPDDMKHYVNDDNNITRFSYPVVRFPEKVKSLNMETTPLVKGVLFGIKGQYLIFNSGEVLNIRKFGGYMVSIGINNE